MTTYNTLNAAIRAAKNDEWAKNSGFAVIQTVSGDFDYRLAGQPAGEGNTIEAKYRFNPNNRSWKKIA